MERIDTGTSHIIVGDVREGLRSLPDESVQCCVTSPPYWSLRDYQVEGQIGCEPTPVEYITNLVSVCRELRRVLRSDGTFWLNVGDTYAQSQMTIGSAVCKPKDLIGIPWMLAIALREDGWYLRSEVIWRKMSPMPESVRDRPTKSHEQIFLLTKSPKYYYDVIASQEKATGLASGNKIHKGSSAFERGDVKHRTKAGLMEIPAVTRRNMRTVWPIASYPLKALHFAAFPPELVRRCLSAGTSENGCCDQCGAPRIRIVQRNRVATRHGNKSKIEGLGDMIVGNRDKQRHVTETQTIGWESSCKCGSQLAPVPCHVLDCFHGAGTTMKVCDRLGLRYTGIELNAEYVQLSIDREPVRFPGEKSKSRRKPRCCSRQRWLSKDFEIVAP